MNCPFCNNKFVDVSSNRSACSCIYAPIIVYNYYWSALININLIELEIASYRENNITNLLKDSEIIFKINNYIDFPKSIEDFQLITEKLLKYSLYT